MKRFLPWLWIAAVACSTSLPQRFVIERDLGSYRYRRYQETLEAELPIAGNRAHGHTAAYLRRNAHGPGVEAVTAFVTVYERPARITETLRAELAALPGYALKTESIAGHYAWVLGTSSEASFYIWTSGPYVVKLGVPAGARVPDVVAAPYAALYPSDLDSFGHARQGAASGGTEPDADDADDTSPNPTQSSANPGSNGSGALADAGGPR